MKTRTSPSSMEYRTSWKYRVLVGAAVAFPIVVGGVTAILVAHALGGGWLWALLGLVGVLAAFGGGVIAIARWSRRNPGEAQAYVDALGRMQAGFPSQAVPPKEFGDAGQDGDHT